MAYSLKAVPAAILPLPGWECFFGQNDQSFYPAVFYVWIVRGENTVGIIDTGLPPDIEDQKSLIEVCQAVDPKCQFGEIVTIDRLLGQEGLKPEDIDFVILTQPITYHSGGLEGRFFPNADVYISRAGVFELLLESVGHPPRQFYFTETSWSFLRSLLVNERLHLIDEDTEIRPGIFFETTGGHHPGSAAIRVDTEDGVVGILETAFFQRNIDEELPIGIAEDASACRRAIRRYKKVCDVVVAIHEPNNTTLFK